MAGSCFVLKREPASLSVRVRGRGTGVVLIPGGLQTAADFDRLAEHLSSTFTAIVVDRRGRGSSSDLTPSGGLVAEAEDVLSVAKAMDAHHLFGLSSGALIALKAAQLDPRVIRSVALYEPPLATPAHAEAFDWTDDVAKLLEADQKPAALARMIEVVGDHWAVRLAPRSLLRLTARIALRWGRGADGQQLSDLLPTFRQDARLVRDARELLPQVGTLRARTLLLSGDRAAEPLTAALDALARELPSTERLELRGVGHLGAANGGKPMRVASELTRFFAES